MYQCSECGAESVAPLPSEAQYASAYRDFDAGRLARQHFDEYVRFAKELLRRAGVAGSKTFFDYGCGGGHFVRAAEQLGLAAVGMEVDPVSVQAARERGLDVRSGRLPGSDALQGQRFDGVLAFHVLEHVPSPYETFRSLEQHTAPGGRILIGVPDQCSFPAGAKKMLRGVGIKRSEWGYVQPPIHVHGFRARTLESLGQRFALRLETLERVSPLDRSAFPSTPAYWRGLWAQRAIYALARMLRSPGYLFAVYRKPA